MFGGVLKAASGAQLWVGLGVLLFVSITPTWMMHNYMKKQCVLKFDAAVGQALKEKIAVDDAVRKATDAFEDTKDEKYLEITQGDILAGQELAMSKGHNAGFLEGQKHAIENFVGKGSCLSINYANDSQLLSDSEELRSRIFGSQ